MIATVKNILREIYPFSKTNINRRKQLNQFKELLAKNANKPLKVVIGSSQKFTENWIPSEVHFLNLLDQKDWYKYFEENSIDALLAEHVWEHLTLEQGNIAARTCHKFLKKNGRLRVAVPDGFHSDSEYIDYVKVGGHGLGADDHKVLYNFKSFSEVFSANGFAVELVEYFDENGTFHANPWNEEDGYIKRSIRYDDRNTDGNPNYTSLIIDAVKI
ncbi:MAG: hypothetical protein ABJN95_09980 [Maribacter sp.]|uniref:class I SAM-dependent methyltransferase n=1 Tax=Maribacter sp. TaxID=1897614 RepID=UPI003299E5D9